jgi:hypothetical protein
MLGARGVAFALVLGWCLPAPAQDPRVGPEALTGGVPGADVVKVKCVLCHDAGPIVRAKLSRGEWEDTLQLMLKRGAPLAADELPVILEYLTRNYGRSD